MGIIKKLQQKLCIHDMHKIKEYNFKVTNLDNGDNATVINTKYYKCFYCGKIESMHVRYKEGGIIESKRIQT